MQRLAHRRQADLVLFGQLPQHQFFAGPIAALNERSADAAVDAAAHRLVGRSGRCRASGRHIGSQYLLSHRHHALPNGGRPNNVDARLIGPSSLVAASSAGASACIRAGVSRVRGPAMLITPIATPPRITGAAIAVMPGANTSSIDA